MHETGRSGPVHLDDPEDGVEREVGGWFSGWGDTCTPMADSC